MRSAYAAVFLAAVVGLGCASLILRPHDSTRNRVAKVGTRVLLVPLTFGLSELAIDAEKKQAEADRAAAAAWNWRHDKIAERERLRAAILATEDSQERERLLLQHAWVEQEIRDFDARQQALDEARRALLMALILQRAQPVYSPARAPVRCTSVVSGNTVQTYCQ